MMYLDIRPDTEILILGGQPGYSDESTGKPFSGRINKQLNELIAILGVDPRECSTAYICEQLVTEKVPKKQIQESYKERIVPILGQFKYVIGIGAMAVTAILGKGKITENAGMNTTIDDKIYMFSMDPAITFRQPQKWDLVKAHWYNFSLCIQGRIEDEKVLNYTLVNTPNKARAMIKSLASADAISYDIETTGLNPLDPRVEITCLGLGVDGAEWVIPIDHEESPWSSDDRNLKKILESVIQVTKGKKLIAQNGKFDNKMMLTKLGWRFHQTFDTMLASAILNENTPNGLKAMATVLLNAPSYALEDHGANEIDIRKLAKYNAYDVHYTLRLYHLQRKELLADKPLSRIFNKLIMPASRAFEDVELHGAYIDPNKVDNVISQLYGSMQASLKTLAELSGHDDINWNSSQQLAKLLYDEMGLPILELTKSGKPSTNGESVLPRLRDKHPIISELLSYREQKKLLEFPTKWKEVSIDSRIHPSFLLHGTVTGRISCKDPNLQQVPRNKLVRSLISAPPGWTLCEADYSQAELRIAAIMSGDPTLKMCFQTGIDVHQKTASNVMGVPLEEVTKDQRKKAKAVNFGFLYGMSAKKFREYARDKYGVDYTEEEAIETRQRFFESYFALPTWHDRMRRIVKKYGYVRSLIGRKRNLPDIYSSDKKLAAEAERQAINSPVQGLGSDFNIFSLVRMAHTLDMSRIKIVGTVHDAILFEVRNDYLEGAVPIVVDIMTDMEHIERVFKTQITVPIDVEVKAGPWGSGEVVYDDINGVNFDKLRELSRS